MLVPAAIARCLERPEARRAASLAAAGLLLVVSAMAILDSWNRDGARAAEPLGHHSALGGWLLVLLPIAVLPALRSDRRTHRVLAVAAALAGLAALGLTRSLGAGIGLVVELVLLAVWMPRWRKALAVAALAAIAFATPRALDIASGADVSSRARLGYARAALLGSSLRPWLGWGPGSTAWTVDLHTVPRPGTSPPGEVIGDLHSTPLTVTYELGAAGAAATLLLLGIGASGWRPRAPDSDRVAGLVALAGCGGFALAFSAWSTAAVTAAAFFAAGFAMPAAGGDTPRRSWALTIFLGVAGVAMLSGPDLAHLAYDRAAVETTPAHAREQLEIARAADPGFPLYPLRLAWLTEDPDLATSLAIEAADAAPGVLALRLAAGALARHAGDRDLATAELTAACRLDPVSPHAPLLLASLHPDRPEASAWAGLALLGEPRFLAATLWERNPDLLTATLGRIEAWRGLDPDWHAEFLGTARRFPQPVGDVGLLTVRFDATTSQSPSLYTFRRQPWVERFAGIEVRFHPFEAVPVPPASGLPRTSPLAFEYGC